MNASAIWSTSPAHGATHRSGPAWIAPIGRLAVCMALLLAACTGGGQALQNPGEPSGPTASAGGDAVDGVLTIAATFPPLSLNPALSGGDNPNLWYIEPAYTPLVIRGPDDYTPGLATSWGYVDDARTEFELELRPDVKFSDGEDLDAEAVRDWLLYVAEAGGPFSGSYDFANVEAVGPLTVRITLNSPDPGLLLSLSHHKTAAHVASPAALADPEALGTQTFGAGPYMLDESDTVTNQTYTYVPNPNYWAPDDIQWEKVVVKVMADENASLLAMQAGEVDLMIGSSSTEGAATDAGLTVHRDTTIPAIVALMDRDGALVPALEDVRVRQALSYALDREAIATLISGPDNARPSQQLALPGLDGYSEELNDLYPYDVERARELLAEAGYADGFDLTLYAYDAGPGWVESAEAIAPYWEEVGVSVDIRVPPSVQEWVGNMTSQEVAAAIWFAKNDDMWSYATDRLFGFLNPHQSSDATVDSLLQEAREATDAERDEVYVRLQERLLELAWFVPYLYEDTIYYTQEESLGGVAEQMQSERWVVYPNLQDFYPA